MSWALKPRKNPTPLRTSGRVRRLEASPSVPPTNPNAIAPYPLMMRPETIATAPSVIDAGRSGPVLAAADAACSMPGSLPQGGRKTKTRSGASPGHGRLLPCNPTEAIQTRTRRP